MRNMIEISHKLPSELEVRALREMSRPSDTKGTFCNIWLYDKLAAKSPNDDKGQRFSYDGWQEVFGRDAEIADDLIPKGVRTPRVYGVSRQQSGKPFMVMDRLPILRVFSSLPLQYTQEFIQSFERQCKIIKDSGYTIDDLHFDAANEPNCGFDIPNREVWFYDFDFWKKK